MASTNPECQPVRIVRDSTGALIGEAPANYIPLRYCRPCDTYHIPLPEPCPADDRTPEERQMDREDQWT